MKRESNWLPKLIAIDLDGTLLTSESRLAPEGSRLLQKAARNGVYVVVASGRFIISIKGFCRLLDISSPIICMNGALVYASPDGPVLASLSFPRETGLEIARLADENGWDISIVVDNVNHHRQRPGQDPGVLTEGRAVVANYVDAVTADPSRVLTHDPEAIDAITALVESKYSGSCYIDMTYREDGSVSSLGIYPKGTDKGTALDLVLGYLGIEWSDVVAIGDNVNDISMFERARVSVAMSNAIDKVKQAATVIAPRNDDEGVAWALQELDIA